MTTKVTITNEGSEPVSVSNIDPHGTSSGIMLMPGHTTEQYVWGNRELVINERPAVKEPE